MTLPVYVATAEDVFSAMSMSESIALMGKAFSALRKGAIDQPLRSIVKSPLSTGFLGLMPACVNDPDIYPIPVYGAKIGTLFPDNAKRGLDPHQGCVMLLSGHTGETLAIIDASSITALRTAAVTGLATSLLAREDATTLTLFGAGHQAEWQLKAVAAVRPLKQAFIVTRQLDSARKFADRLQAQYGFPLQVAEDPAKAVQESDIVVTATNSAVPVLRREWVQPGTHITAMGSSTPSHCEIDGSTMAAASMFVDLAASTVKESGEYINALRDGFITADKTLTDLGTVLENRAHGRKSAEDITLFKSLGLALEDVVTAAALHRRHMTGSAGTIVHL